MADIDALLQPVSDEAPSGPDLSYDPARQEIEQAFDTSASGEAGEDDTDWTATIRLILDQGTRTRDIWLGVYLARAGARAGRLDTVEEGCAYLAGLFETFWDSVHPTLDEYGFVGRKGPCESLTRIGEFIGPLRRTPLIQHPRLGSYSGEDIERFAEQGDAADGYGMFRAALEQTDEEEIRATIDRLDHIRDAIRRVDKVLTENADGDTGTNFTPTYEALEAIRRGLAPYAGLDQAEEASADGDESHDSEAPRNGAARGNGRIESREDVVRALDAVMDYYRLREPASPVPVALNRAKRWVTMDFLSVIEDIAPDSLSDARRVLASRSDYED